MGILLITLVAFGFIVLIMSVGVIFKGQCLRGSCGGEEIWGPDDELLNCASCPVHDKEQPATD